MADVKISTMTPGTTPLAGTELFEMVQSGATVSTTAAAIANSATGTRSIATGGTNATSQTANGVAYYDGSKITTGSALVFSGGNLTNTGGITSSSATAGVGYATGAGGTVTQTASRTTGVTINKRCGTITLFSAAGSTSPTTFTVSNSTVAATDSIRVHQKTGTDLYQVLVTAVSAGQFNLTFFTTGGTTVEQPTFTFAVMPAVAA